MDGADQAGVAILERTFLFKVSGWLSVCLFTTTADSPLIGT